jgi:PPM family protein phosphatase
MATSDSEQTPPQPGGLQSMLERLRGMVQALKSPEPQTDGDQEFLPTWDVSGAPSNDSTGQGDPAPDELAETIPKAELVEPAMDPMGEQPLPENARVEQTAPSIVEEPLAPLVAGEQAPAASVLAEPTLATDIPAQPCPYCQAPRKANAKYCDDCGWVFPVSETSPLEPAQPNSPTGTRLKDRFEIGRRYDAREKVVRFLGLDHHNASPNPTPIVVVRETLSEATVAHQRQASLDTMPIPLIEQVRAEMEGTESMPEAEPIVLGPNWPSVAWERDLLRKLDHPFFPSVIESFADDNQEYLIEEQPAGLAFWDAWDDPNSSDRDRFVWLKQIALALDRLHQQGVIVEGLRPEILVVTGGQARITDLSGLLPLPLPEHPLIRASYYTAPELVLTPEKADGRADLYSFGALLYALHLGRELTELDFEMQGVPKSILVRLPEIHPDFGRLIAKTFCRNPEARFPTEEAAKEDRTGFKELIDVLDHCGRSLDGIRLEIGAWTTTGMVRTGNEDAFAVFHSAESFENDLGDRALVLLADGMGGYEAGEVAARLTLQTIQANLSKQEPFSELLMTDGSPSDRQDASPAPTSNLEASKGMLAAALREANERVYTASRSESGRTGMGCTAEIVYLDGRNLLVGHVGDSRVYHLRGGQLNQVTRDHTWVNRMVEIGAISPEEAANHARHSELYQAIGGHSEVEPAIYDQGLKPGDCILVCSDGLSNHVSLEAITEILMAAGSAERAARRLVNFANLHGATDNVTVVVIRAR